MNAYYLNQFISTTLSTAGGIDDSQTTGIKIASTSGITTDKPGILCLSYSSSIDTTKAEWITYTSIDISNELQGVTRGAEGFSAKSHSNGVTVAFPISRSHINNLNDALIIGGDETNLLEGVLDEDTFASDSATKGATQQSIKAYVNSNASVASSATPSPTGDKFRNSLYITALAEDAEFAAPSGTPANGNMLLIRVKDDGTARALTYNAIYDGTLDDLPSTTTISKTLYILFVYNSEATKWELISVGEEG
jgi:hypothetical protein